MNIFADLENSIGGFIKKLSKAQIYSFFATFVVGIVAHGYVIFNRISYHDNTASLFSYGGTFESGRWLLGIIYRIQLLTTKTFAVPVFNGLLSMLFIALSAMMIVEIFELSSKVSGALVGALMIVYPVVTSIYSYMFTSWPYFLALLLAVAAARRLVLAQQGNNTGVQAKGDNGSDAKVVTGNKASLISGFLVGAILLACSLGIYQAFLGVTVTIFLTKMLQDVLKGKTESVGSYAKTGFLDVACLVVGLVIWAVLRVVFQKALGIEAVEYQGMNEGYSLSLLPGRIALAIKSFLGFGSAGVNSLKYLRGFTMLIFVVAVVQLIVLLIKSAAATSVKISSIVGIVLLPIAMNLVYLLSTSDSYNVESLMVYANIFVLLIPVIFIEQLSTHSFEAGVLTSGVKVVTSLQAILLLVMIVGYTYLDNAAYFKADMMQEQAIAYYTEMVANIKSCDGFNDDMEIVFVGWEYLDDGTIANPSPLGQLDAIQLEKYPDLSEILVYGGTKYFIQEHLGFFNEKVSINYDEFTHTPEVEAMPCYPNDGSIAIVDGRVVVKLGEE